MNTIGVTSVEVFIVLALTTLIILILVVAVAIVSIRAGQRQARAQILLVKTQANFEKELRQVETEVSESMMERFARELHDNIGHHLTLIRLVVENLKLDHPDLERQLSAVDLSLNDANQQLRLLSRSLNTDYINQVGLKAAIQIEVERLRQLGRHNVTWQCSEQIPSLSQNQELLLFRIFQEILQNCLRHAHANAVSIALSHETHSLLTVTDNGSGFDVADVLRSGRASGLKNILRRAAIAGMECSIESQIGLGSTYAISLVGSEAMFA